MSEDELIEANPCKLRNGNWGCKTAEPVQVGDTVQIVTRANKQWRAQVTQIVWTDEQVCICETASDNSNANKASQTKSTSRGAANNDTNKSATPAPADQPTVPPAPAMPSEELDAMADRAAEQDDEYDDMMSAMQEFERNPQ